ncbi:MAG: invasion associated locus B family protein [Pseudorhodobacter sp.]|nr:invasion associated locus B family protein [Pseudorhodobacter sp.]
MTFPLCAISAFCLWPTVLPAVAFGFEAGDWFVNCEPSDGCILSQSLMGEDRTWLATVLVIPEKSGGAGAQVQFIVPAGVHLASGLFAAFGGVDARRAEWIKCASDACRADLALDSAEIDAWKRGRSAEIRYRARADGEVIAFPVSLTGFTAAIAHAKADLQ